MKKVTSGKMGVTLAFFTGTGTIIAMWRYMKDICDLQVSEVRKHKHNKDGPDKKLLYSQPTEPTSSVKC